MPNLNFLYNIGPRCVRGWLSETETGDSGFSKDEIKKAIKKLNPGKAPGHDGVTKEHLVAAGDTIVECLHVLFKWI